jgi:predicted nuclease of predicted toxin-antitoxin system
VRFLIDECLSVDLVTVAGNSGHEARHIAHVGRAGWKDWNVVRYASAGDFILVTNNASDSGSSMRLSRSMPASSF